MAKRKEQEDINQEYRKSIERIANFVDNFCDFMYHTIKETDENVPDDVNGSNVHTFLTGMRKEIADFQVEIKNLRDRFNV